MTNATLHAAPPQVAVSLPELVYEDIETAEDEARARVEAEWKQHVTRGKEARNSGQKSKWDMGREAVAVAERWNRKAKKTLIAFALAIGMGDEAGGAGRIYELHDTAEFWPESACAQISALCQNATWSHFRYAMRQAKRENKSADEAATWLYAASDEHMNANAFNEWLRKGKPGFVTKRRYFEGEIGEIKAIDDKLCAVTFIMPASEVQDLKDCQGQSKFEAVLRGTWEQALLPDTNKVRA
jgi:hypothetical protein